MKSAAEVLGHIGKKLKAHEIHVRRSENGMIAKNVMRDKDGNPPNDGQRSEKEYNIDNLAQLASHFATHMPESQQPDEDEDDQGGGGAPSGPPPPQGPQPPPQPGQ